ncbi:MAG: protein YgfX [Betaproteobacteria bacterium]
MHLPDPLDIALAPSRVVRAWIVAVTAATFALTLALPVDAWVHPFSALLLAAWAAFRLRSAGQGRRALRHLRIDGDRRVLVTTADGRSQRGRLLSSSCVGARLTTLVWRPDGRRFACAGCLLPDMLPPDAFRRLRVLLRYGRSELTQGAPPSHA